MTIKAYIMINLKSGSEEEVCSELAKFEEVENVTTVYGEYDAIVKINAEDMAKLDNFLLEKLRGLSNIILTATMLIAKEYK